jgi:ABC-type transport system involved in multi-copper enzyme maturation permease subunit
MTTIDIPAGTRRMKPVSQGRLTIVELRKMVDTRAGIALLVLVGLVAVTMTVVRLFAGGPETRTFQGFLTFTVIPVSIVLPVVGILAVTSEWSQRTALATFSLVPKRTRVALAKLLAVGVLALITAGLSVALAAAGNALAPALADSDGSWQLEPVLLVHVLLYQVISLFIGFAFGMVTMTSVLAIVVYFALPTVWSILRGLIEGFRTAASWLDLNVSLSPLAGAEELSGESWAKVIVSLVVWGVLPTLAGLARWRRSEVK